MRVIFLKGLDTLIEFRTFESIVNYIVIIAVTILVRKLSNVIADYLKERLVFIIGQYHVNVVLEHIGNLSAAQLTASDIKEKLLRLGSVEISIQQYFEVIKQILIKPIFIIFNLIIFASLSPILSILLSILIIMNTLIHIKYSNNPKSIHYIQSGYSAIAYIYMELFDADHTEDRKVYRLKDYLKSRLNHILQVFYKELRKATNNMRLLSLMLGILWMATELTNIYLLITRYLSGQITIGDITFDNSIFSKINNKSQLFTYNMQNLSRYSFYLLDTLDLLEMHPQDKTISTNAPKEIDFKEIRFKNVTFQYPMSNSKVIDNLTTTIIKNEKIALIGKNGAGKTTFIRLLLGLYKPTSGEIELVTSDNNVINMNNINKTDWFYSLNYISQNYFK